MVRNKISSRLKLQIILLALLAFSCNSRTEMKDEKPKVKQLKFYEAVFAKHEQKLKPIYDLLMSKPDIYKYSPHNYRFGNSPENIKALTKRFPTNENTQIPDSLNITNSNLLYVYKESDGLESDLQKGIRPDRYLDSVTLKLYRGSSIQKFLNRIHYEDFLDVSTTNSFDSDDVKRYTEMYDKQFEEIKKLKYMITIEYLGVVEPILEEEKYLSGASWTGTKLYEIASGKLLGQAILHSTNSPQELIAGYGKDESKIRKGVLKRLKSDLKDMRNKEIERFYGIE